MVRLVFLVVAFTAAVTLIFCQRTATAQDAEPGITDIADIAIGDVRLSAEPILQRLGCRLVASISIDDTDGIHIADRYDVETVRELLRWQTYLPLLDVSPSLLDQVYRCRDNQLILISTEHDQPKRIGAVSIVYCALNEEEGAQRIYDKVGSRKLAFAHSEFGQFDIFYPKSIAGTRLQQTSGRLSLRFPDHIYATAYKKPDGCFVDFLPQGFLYGLTMRSKPVFSAAADRTRKFRQRKIDSMKTTPRF